MQSLESGDELTIDYKWHRYSESNGPGDACEFFLDWDFHGLFINDASDEGLGRNHWFWNRDMSGGIFVEHGVHFFDLVADWLGPATVVAAARSVRPHAENTAHEPVEEQVCCTCRYATEIPQTGVLMHFVHGFHQPSRLDRHSTSTGTRAAR